MCYRRTHHTNMLWSAIFLFAILSGYSLQEIPVDERFNISEVDLTSVPSTRIIGGAPTTIERWPFTVQVLFNNRLSCGGTIVTRRHVLSAAHCFVDQNDNLINARNFRIRAGSARLNSGGSVHRVSTIVVHENYNRPILRDNDVAVLLLSSAVRISDRIAVATLPLQGSTVPDNVTVFHVGWGRTNVNIPQAAPILNEVAVRSINHTLCRQRYEYLQSLTGVSFHVTVNMICAGLLDIGGADACQGDSGGPLIYSGVVVGVTSWGYGCAEPFFPGVSARVASYTNWISHVVSQLNASPPMGSASVALLLPMVIGSLILNNNRL